MTAVEPVLEVFGKVAVKAVGTAAPTKVIVAAATEAAAVVAACRIQPVITCDEADVTSVDGKVKCFETLIALLMSPSLTVSEASA